MKIFYTVMNSPLGCLLVAATARGLCTVQFGDSEQKLAEDLRRWHPTVQIQREEARLSPLIEALQEYFRGRKLAPMPPLDVQATAFQRCVWQEVQKIPYGQTRSYREIARAIGRPQAARAVGRACATNPVAIVIPCHRVIRADGSLGGYGGGIARKRALLFLEGALSPRPFHGTTFAPLCLK